MTKGLLEQYPDICAEIEELKAKDNAAVSDVVQASADEFFVSYDAASKGVVVKNTSLCEPLVMLKHFPWYPAVPAAEAEG